MRCLYVFLLLLLAGCQGQIVRDCAELVKADGEMIMSKPAYNCLNKNADTVGKPCVDLGRSGYLFTVIVNAPLTEAALPQKVYFEFENGSIVSERSYNQTYFTKGRGVMQMFYWKVSSDEAKLFASEELSLIRIETTGEPFKYELSSRDAEQLRVIAACVLE